MDGLKTTLRSLLAGSACWTPSACQRCVLQVTQLLRHPRAIEPMIMHAALPVGLRASRTTRTCSYSSGLATFLSARLYFCRYRRSTRLVEPSWTTLTISQIPLLGPG